MFLQCKLRPSNCATLFVKSTKAKRIRPKTFVILTGGDCSDPIYLSCSPTTAGLSSWARTRRGESTLVRMCLVKGFCVLWRETETVQHQEWNHAESPPKLAGTATLDCPKCQKEQKKAEKHKLVNQLTADLFQILPNKQKREEKPPSEEHALRCLFVCSFSFSANFPSAQKQRLLLGRSRRAHTDVK